MSFYKELRKHRIQFNQENVISNVSVFIPDHVKFVASLGWKFNFVHFSHESFPFDDVSIAFRKMLDETNEFGQNYFLKKELKEMCKNNFGVKIRDGSEAQKFIYDQFLKTISFMNLNKDIIVLPADKGGKSIITSKELYFEKMDQFISDCLADGTYISCEPSKFEDIRSDIEGIYSLLRSKLSVYFKIDGKMKRPNLCGQLSSEPYIMSRLRGSLKAHKPGFPVRPIISAPDCLGRNASEWLLKKLGIIAEFFKGIKIHSAFELFSLVADIQLPETHRLVTWDYSSMFTNIPFDWAKSIISKYYYLLQGETSVPVELFIDLLTFLVDEVAYFSYKGVIYKQNRGIAMGNCLSQCIAEIVTSFAIYQAFKVIDKDKISFLVKYVDDLGGAMDESIISVFESHLNGIVSGLRVEREDEDNERSITYLNCKLRRRTDNTIGFSWWNKPYSSRQILNFHSNHPYHTKWNVVKEYIKNALAITTDECVSTTVSELKTILRRSSYPNNFFEKYIFESLMDLGKLNVSSESGSTDNNLDCERELLLRWGRKLPTKIMEKNNQNSNGAIRRKNEKFVKIPFNKSLFRSSNRIVKKYNLGIKLAPYSANKNGRFVFSNMKDRKEMSNVRNGLFSVRCMNCKFRMWVKTTNLDVERTLKFQFCHLESKILEHMNLNVNHVIPFSIFELRSFANRIDLGIAYELKIKNDLLA